jgi:hypothetical protein
VERSEGYECGHDAPNKMMDMDASDVQSNVRIVG